MGAGSRTGKPRSGKVARESRIGLDEQRRLLLARELRDLLTELDDDQPAAQKLSHFAVEVVAAFDGRLPLYRPEVQQAVEISRAPLFESLEQELSSEIRAEWATALASDAT